MHDHVQREREEILSSWAAHGEAGNSFALQGLAAEVLLDCRDLLREIAVGLSEVRSNTEAVAVRAETMLPAPYQAEPPFVVVEKCAEADGANALLAAGWVLLGGGSDGFTLAKRAKGPSG